MGKNGEMCLSPLWPKHRTEFMYVYIYRSIVVDVQCAQQIREFLVFVQCIFDPFDNSLKIHRFMIRIASLHSYRATRNWRTAE